MNYELDLSFTHEDLDYLAQLGQHVSMAKAVGNDMANVVWVSFKPAPENSITWEETFGLYYTNKQELQDGTVITQDDKLDSAQDGQPYEVGGNWYIKKDTDTSDTCPGGSFFLKNNAGISSLVGGLYQSVNIGGQSVLNKKGLPPVINASPIGMNQYGLFTPKTTVYIWVESTTNETGSVISRVSGNPTPVVFEEKTPQKFHFDKKTSTFLSDTGVSGKVISYPRKKGVFQLGQTLLKRACKTCKADVSVYYDTDMSFRSATYIIGCRNCGDREGGGTVSSRGWPNPAAGSYATLDME